MIDKFRAFLLDLTQVLVFPKRILYLFLVIGFGLSLILGSCRSDYPARLSPQSTDEEPSKIVRIGHQPHGAPLFLRSLGNLEKRLSPLGITVEWTEFPAGAPILTAMGKNKIDLGYAGVVPPLLAQAEGIPFLYIGNEAVSPETLGILVLENSPIKSLSDLKGKKISATQKSVGYYFLIQVLSKAGLTLEDAQFIPLSPTEGMTALKTEKVDAWIGWNPFLAQAQEIMPARLLANAEGLVNDRNFYLATPSFIAAHPDIVAIVLEEMRQAGIWATQQPEAAADILGNKMGLKPSTALTVIKVHAFEAQPIQDGAIEEQQRVADTFFRLGLLTKQIRVEDAVWKGSLIP